MSRRSWRSTTCSPCPSSTRGIASWARSPSTTSSNSCSREAGRRGRPGRSARDGRAPPPAVSLLRRLRPFLLVLGIVLARGSFGRIQYLFVAIGVAISVAYYVSADLAQPDWADAALSLVVPRITLTQAYFLTLVGVVGTTITPWGQALIQSYIA